MFKIDFLVFLIFNYLHFLFLGKVSNYLNFLFLVSYFNYFLYFALQTLFKGLLWLLESVQYNLSELFPNFQILLWSLCLFLSVFPFCFQTFHCTKIGIKTSIFTSIWWLTTILKGNEPSTTNGNSKKSSNNSTGSMKLFATKHRWWLCWLSKGSTNPQSDYQTNVATSRRAATKTNTSHRSGHKSTTKAWFTLVQLRIVIFTSPFHYRCMSVKIRELLSSVTTTTSNKGFQSVTTASSWWLSTSSYKGFLWTRWVFFHLFKILMIFDFHSGGIFNKGSNGSWIVHLEKMIFISIIELTIMVKITKNLRWGWIYRVSTVDYTLKTFLVGSIPSKTFLTIWIFQKKIK